MADPVSVVKDYDAAWNAHDVEGVLDFFTDDAEVRMEPAPPDDEFGGSIRAKSRSALASSNRLWKASTSTLATIN